MRINLSLYASLASRLPEKCTGNSCTLELAEGTCIRESLDQLNIGLDEPKVMFIDGVHARLHDMIKDGDGVGIFPPIADDCHGILRN